jgi:hypothetical protein
VNPGRRRRYLGHQVRVGRILHKAAQGLSHRQIGDTDVAELHTPADQDARPTPDRPCR